MVLVMGVDQQQKDDHRHSGLPVNKSVPQEQKDEHRKTKEQPQEEGDG